MQTRASQVPLAAGGVPSGPGRPPRLPPGTLAGADAVLPDGYSHYEDRLLRPLDGHPGWNKEMRELAAIIERDIYVRNPNVSWSSIVGLDDAKRLVKEAVVYPIKYPQLFQGILAPWKGLLLYGPPGTGKTMLAKAVATECSTTFFNISASTIVSKWRGDSEKLVRMLFELARYHAPSTIFLDELESVISQRSGASAGASNEHEGSLRMKTELLIQMDGLARTDELVFVLAASNLPWELDPAMLRRLEKRIHVGLPTLEARRDMFEKLLPATIGDPYGNNVVMETQLDYGLLAERTEGYSGSDITLVSREAAMSSLRKVFFRLERGDFGPGGTQASVSRIRLEPLTTEDVLTALEKTKPSATQLLGRYDEWSRQFGSV
jgi:katanin p60 ATPase-containing subunit A1